MLKNQAFLRGSVHIGCPHVATHAGKVARPVVGNVLQYDSRRPYQSLMYQTVAEKLARCPGSDSRKGR